LVEVVGYPLGNKLRFDRRIIRVMNCGERVVVSKCGRRRSRNGVIDVESMVILFTMTPDANRSCVVKISDTITSGALEKSFARGVSSSPAVRLALWLAGRERDLAETEDDTELEGERRREGWGGVRVGGGSGGEGEGEGYDRGGVAMRVGVGAWLTSLIVFNACLYVWMNARQALEIDWIAERKMIKKVWREKEVWGRGEAVVVLGESEEGAGSEGYEMFWVWEMPPLAR
jgi:hypothetical protein